MTFLKFKRFAKKAYWKLSAVIAAKRYPLNESLIYTAVTGTDGKTTTCSFLYEIAKVYGFKPLLLTTVSAKFEDKDIEVQLKSSSFFAYSIKNLFKNLSSLNAKGALINLFFLDKKGYGVQEEAHRTTPLASEIRRLIRKYESKGANFFIIETTSHAIDQYRVYGIKFDSIAYTNITDEHLDYHGNWQSYAETKALLINQLKKNGSVSLNRDDERSFKLLSNAVNNYAKKQKVNGFSFGVENEVSCKNFWIQIEQRKENLVYITASNEARENNSYHASLSIYGDYNIYNSLAALSCFIGVTKAGEVVDTSSFAPAVKALANLREIKGRMNFLSESPTVIVDFAHTPNAFKNTLNSVRKLLKTSNSRMWVVFGAAGLRDKHKRPEMGRFAFKYGDNILITSEDPRTEDLYDINNEIIKGFEHLRDQFTIYNYYEGLKYAPEEGKKFIVRFDEPNVNSRRNAIKFALENASKEDVVIILGKGHETTMCFGEKEYEWNDIDEVKSLSNAGLIS